MSLGSVICKDSAIQQAIALSSSGATFPIIGLTKIPKIEFFLLDWIYRSIRIMTVTSLNTPSEKRTKNLMQ